MIDEYDMDLIVLTETKKKGQGTEELNNYIHFYSGVNKDVRAKCGVSILIKTAYRKSIKSWEFINERIILLHIKLKGRDLDIIGAYAPTNDSPDSIKNEFYDELTTLLQRQRNRRELLLLGDLNARTGRKYQDQVVGQHGEEVCNDNGERLIELCTDFSLRIENGFFSHKNIHKYTWTQTTRRLQSIIDYIIAKQKLTTIQIADVKVQRGAECGSDHYLVRAKVKFLYWHKDPMKKTNSGPNKSNPQKYNISGLLEDSTKFLYKLRLASKIRNSCDAEGNMPYETLCSIVHEAAAEALGTAQTSCKNRNNAIWWTEDLSNLVQQKKKAYSMWLQTQLPGDRSAYSKLNREVKRKVQVEKNHAWQKKCAEIGQLIGGTRSKEAWRTITNMRKDNNENANLNLINMDQWVKYYQSLLVEDRQFAEDTHHAVDKDDHQKEFVPKITTQEIASVLRTMKNGKAPGPGNLPIELIKYAPVELFEILAKLFNTYLYGGNVPHGWRVAIISSLFKKGDRKNCANYRGISVINSICKIYCRILKVRIENEMDEMEEQAGFRAGRSCIDNIFTLKQLTEKRNARNLETHLVFVDLKKAYDSVPLQKLWVALGQHGVNTTYINAIKNIYSDMYSSVKLGLSFSSEFRVNKGLRQGCCLAPTLFKIYLTEALKTWKHKCQGMGIPIGEETLYSLYFADDQVLIAAEEFDIQYMLRKLNEEYERWGLQISWEKTEYLTYGTQKQDLKLDNIVIKACERFRYLGVTFNREGSSAEEVQTRIRMGRSCTSKLNSLLWSSNITSHTKRMLYKTLVESVSLYGSELWEINKRSRKKLTAMEMNFWRRSCGLTLLDRVRNTEIRERMQVSEEDIMDSIEQRRLQWYGHVCRMPDTRWPKKILHWVPIANRRRGRPRRSWFNDVTEAMENRGLDDEDWRNREIWRLGCGKRRKL